MNVIVLSGYGLNCEEETMFAFLKAGELLSCNVQGKIVHINEIVSNPKLLKSYNVLVIPGGFSYGDDTGAGNAFALRILNNLKEEIEEFLTEDKLVLGVCNGCQILMRLISDFSCVTLLNNSIKQYQCRWVKVKINSSSNSIWLNGLDTLYIPIAHGEGRFFFEESAVNLSIKDKIALQYVTDKGDLANQEFPDNPNGSICDIAALSANNGRILIMMPHPERAVFCLQQDNWAQIKEQCLRANIPYPIYGDGMKIFCNAVKYFHSF
ncbi:phosphoribosylformylglycinamidine synthase subunit PurQ [Ehrlichia ruminantium]|uniref:Phosphoribosylformylglycinamidine synthase subunit PurQ n=1 Tax=Ehrlichia ruminantium TaxID=779 RepID=A0AAE6UJP2_EHRRU|nr:phosphoribosylformylglycinamidine synthase subunit PurQ [Ehrlichia ruminantium]QGR02705.1 phosphoribosylformylglycinamidine synthase subunit PurQ [Ehrlichia ruminantium]QGR03626.1 phosphoribosylformylglycinamidine synthase subunit PurQ [Ehrlichia ruminantium]QGR04553.1 phosphoribosylformylglycinamidine synthase subunit PurQ [Ehrlichia ruminantium]